MPASVVLTSLGSAVTALGKIGEYLAAPIGRQFTYMCCFDSNFTELETKSKEFKTTREGVQMGVDETHRKVRVVGPTVLAWLTKANDVTRDVERIMEDKGKVKEGCLKWWCPNLKLRYSLSRKAVKTTEVVVDLQAAGVQYTKPSYSRPPVCMEVMPNKDFTEFESRRLNMEEIIKALKSDGIKFDIKFQCTDDKIKGEINDEITNEINLIGICGLPGVGKTKMVQEVRKRVKQEKLFDEVPYVVVGQNPDLTKLQKCVGESLDIADIGRFDDASTRAVLLHKRLVQDNKKILLILDDVWEEFDLLDMGIPLGGSNTNFKILYTSRRQRLWHDVQTKKEISLELLSEDEAWQLFREKAGNLSDASNLQPIAKQIVDECGRLPLALVIIGSTLSKKSGGNCTKDLWEEIHDRLTCPSGTPADKRLLLSIETSYNYVEDEDAKCLFLLCCLFEKGKYISIEDLARYGLGLSLFHGIHEMRKVRRRVVALVNDLMSCYLLLDPEIDGHVKLHDVVRDMGIAIASRVKGFLVSHGNTFEWPKEDTYEDYTSISVILEKTIEFREGLRCPNLRFLLLRCKNLDEMPSNFFEGLKILRVLVLEGYFVGPSKYVSCSLALKSLRYLRTLCLENLNATLGNVSAIGNLEDLEILSLGRCSIDELPTELGKLAKLRLLDLTDCKLLRIRPGVISRLVGLEELYMMDCGFVDWEGEGNEKGINASLREFESLSKLNTLEVRIIDVALWPKSPIFSELEKFSIEIEHPFKHVGWRFRRPKPNCLSISSSQRPIRSEYGGLNSLLRRTECLALGGKGTSDLARELFVERPEGLQLLKDLSISLCPTLECLVNTMNPSPQFNATAPAIFPVLETLDLYMLDNLREICHGPVSGSSFGKLTSLTIKRCNAMEKVIRNDQGYALTTTKTIEFPMLERLELEGLPSLVGFCRGVDKIHFPELKQLRVTNVGLLSLFTQEVSLPNLGKLELINLKNLETLGRGPLSFGSLSKLKQIHVDNCEKLLCVFPSPLLPMLRDLEKLTVELEWVDASEPNTDISSPGVITLRNLPKLKYISKRDPVAFKYIHRLDILHCDCLRYVFAPTMTKSIPQLGELKIAGCKVLSRIVAEENELGESSVDEVEFPQLARLKLDNLPNLVSFFPKVTTTPQPLFNGKVAIPSLKYLELQQLKNLSDQWFSELPTGSFSELKELEVIDCQNLRNMFHLSTVEGLANLEKLVIRNCSKMEAVVDSEEKGQGRDIDKAMFPDLRKVELYNLPNLRTLCFSELPTGLFSELKELEVIDCENLRNIFHLSMVEGLANLEKLVIRNCSKMEAVVDSVEKGQGRDIDTAMFPELRKVELYNLPNLRTFCRFTRPSDLPLLSQLDIGVCPSMDAFCLGHLRFPKLFLPGTSTKDILNCTRRFAAEQDHLEEEGAGERREVRGIVEEGAGGDESERTKRIKGKGVLEA